MSKPREPWWGYVRKMLYRYPSSGTDAEKKAVLCALEATKSMENGESRIAVISAVFFDKTHTLQGAAMNVPCDYATAKRWQQQFIRLVAKERGLLS